MMRRTLLLFGCCLVPATLVTLFPTPARVQPKAGGTLPRVVLVGDSIRLGYAPVVANRLEGKAEVISPPRAGDSTWLVRNLDSLVLTHKPDLVHFNVGLHDLRVKRRNERLMVEVDNYESKLQTVLTRLRKEAPGAMVIFASTTPIDDARHTKRKGGYDRFEKDVRRYNQAALRLMHKNGVVVHDLHSLVHQLGAAKLLAEDGTHYTKEGNQRLADAVADCVLRHLAIRSARPLRRRGSNRPDRATAVSGPDGRTGRRLAGRRYPGHRGACREGLCGPRGQGSLWGHFVHRRGARAHAGDAEGNAGMAEALAC
jgi:lysophospholipase L1-like esterase